MNPENWIDLPLVGAEPRLRVSLAALSICAVEGLSNEHCRIYLGSGLTFTVACSRLAVMDCVNGEGRKP